MVSTQTDSRCIDRVCSMIGVDITEVIIGMERTMVGQVRATTKYIVR